MEQICIRKSCKNVLIGKQTNYCSEKCKKQHCKLLSNQRYKSDPNGLRCKHCNKELIGRQKLFCSNSCKCTYNYTHNKDLYNKASYKTQQHRGYMRKLEFVNTKGGKCEICEYDKNLSALAFHHVNESTKSFNMDIRNISNRSMKLLTDELNKCQLLCHNCHNELHHPHMKIKK